jgi:murein DD-endopeptidase MepM/ murein hydrolase activator NlpD
VANVLSRTTKLYVCIGALFALAVACALPGTASAGSGGSTYLSAPTIMRVTCASGCPSSASTAKAKALAVNAGSMVRVRGRRLTKVLKVQFAGGKKVRPVKIQGSRIDVVVPTEAKSGPVTLLEANGKASKPSSTTLSMVATPTRQTTGLTGSGGSWRIPLPGGYMVTSPFYEARSYEMHPGVDLAISSGTPIYAIGDGRVSQAGSTGGYGNYTCIAHTSAVSSCYAHQSSMLVSSGQSVTKGQLIGRVGCTGSCTGPHLHFEIRVNGSVRCPAPWVGASSAKWCEGGSPGYGSTQVSSKRTYTSRATTAGWVDSKITAPKGDAAD